MNVTATTSEPITLRDALNEARRLAYRLIGIVEVLEHDLGIEPEEGKQDDG